jgi:hypothetical protein
VWGFDTTCGGMTSESVNQQLLADTVASETTEASSARTTGAIDNGAAIARDTVTPDAAAPAMPDPAPTPVDNGVATTAPATRSADSSEPASNEFNLNGYQDTASSSDRLTQGAPATASVDGQPATQLPAE